MSRKPSKAPKYNTRMPVPAKIQDSKFTSFTSEPPNYINTTIPVPVNIHDSTITSFTGELPPKPPNYNTRIPVPEKMQDSTITSFTSELPPKPPNYNTRIPVPVKIHDSKITSFTGEPPPKPPNYNTRIPVPVKIHDSKISSFTSELPPKPPNYNAYRDAVSQLGYPIDGATFKTLDESTLTDMFPDINDSASCSKAICNMDAHKLDEAEGWQDEPEPEVSTENPVTHKDKEEISTFEDPQDPKRLKRILTNRQSAQRSRVKKLHYKSELQHKVRSLENAVETLTPQVAYFDHQRRLLNESNECLRQKLVALEKVSIFKKNQHDMLLKEKEQLTNLLQQQLQQHPQQQQQILQPQQQQQHQMRQQQQEQHQTQKQQKVDSGESVNS